LTDPVTTLVRRRVERLIALADVVRASDGLSATSAAAAAGLGLRAHAFRWMERLQALGVVRRRGKRDQTLWSMTALGRDRRRTLRRIGDTGATAAVPHGGCRAGPMRRESSAGRAASYLVADRALYGNPAMMLVSNGAAPGDVFEDEGDEW